MLLFHSMSTDSSDSDQVDEGQHYQHIRQAINSQTHIIGTNLMVLGISAATMAISSVFFYLGKSKSGTSKPYYNIV